jgi:hypothetical protein
MFVGFSTLEHATYICPCEKHVVLPFTKHFPGRPKQVEKVEEGI